jgi:hypothetical protein
VEDRHAFPLIGRRQPSKKEKNEKSIVKRILKQIKIPLYIAKSIFDTCRQFIKQYSKQEQN